MLTLITCFAASSLLHEQHQNRQQSTNSSSISPPSATARSQQIADFDLGTKNQVQIDERQQQQQRKPRIVQYDYLTNEVSRIEKSPAQVTDFHRVGHVIKNRKDEGGEDDDSSGGKCIPMKDWHSHNFPMCNPLHELDMSSQLSDGSLRYVARGGDRCAFRISDSRSSYDQQYLALKIPRLDRQYTPSKYASARKDGMVMERLTASPYVLTAYGYCGLSQVIEYADGGSIHDLVKRMRISHAAVTKENKDNSGSSDRNSRRHQHQEVQQPLLKPIDKLKVAIQLVSSVAALHDFEKTAESMYASITHNDICCHQFVLVNGVYKLNDFHLSRFATVDRVTKKPCLHPMGIGSRWELIHAPEELRDQVCDSERADDYVVGNVAYYVLTGNWIFEKIPNSLGIEKLLDGERSPFPKDVLESDDPYIAALRRGIEMAWTHDVSRRPTSQQVSEFLISELERISGEGRQAVIRADVPPLPLDWDFKEDPTFDANFD